MSQTVININGYIAPNGYEFYDYITPKMVKKQLEEAQDDVRLDINSGGGSVFASWEIINALQAYDKGEVTTRITGMAASAAGSVFLAGTKREVFDKTYFMAHPSWVITIGDQYELASEAELLKQIDDVLIADLAALTGMPKRTMADKVRNTYNLIGESIMDAGIATEMVEGKASEPAKPIKKAMEEGDEEEQNKLRTALSLIGNRGDIKIAAMYSTNKQEGVFARLKNKLSQGGTTEMTEKEAQALLEKQAAENAEVIKQLEEDNKAAVKAAEDRVMEIYSLAGHDIEAAKKAVADGISAGDFAKQLVMQAQAGKTRAKNSEGFVDSIPDKAGDESIEAQQKALEQQLEDEGAQLFKTRVKARRSA